MRLVSGLVVVVVYYISSLQHRKTGIKLVSHFSNLIITRLFLQSRNTRGVKIIWNRTVSDRVLVLLVALLVTLFELSAILLIRVAVSTHEK